MSTLERTGTEATGAIETSAATARADLTVIVITWNTVDLTLRCLETLFDNTLDLNMRVIVADNNSKDGSADLIAERFPQVEVLRNSDNLGFARANNEAIAMVDTEWVLLLNSDTEIQPNAVNNLLAFSKQHPEAGITGGRTVFSDGSLNKTSCWNKMTAWSLFCYLTGLTLIFKKSKLFNSESIGNWKRDTVLHVDIVTGCLFMIRAELWRRLGGFDGRYFMYGEEVDLCLRAAKLGYRPMITPDAQIIHLGGASAPKGARMLQNWTSKATLVRDHWPKLLIPVGLAELWLCCATRALAYATIGKLSGRDAANNEWLIMWANRHKWIKGY